jgi:hypothetical protein
MLNILTNYGQNNEIKFNGSITTLMIYNKSMGDNRRMFIESENKVKLELSGENVVPTDKMKYLGCIYSDTYSHNKHWDSKENTLGTKMALLERAGINSQGLLSKTKAFLFNCYVRPLIQYGIDTFNLKDVDTRRVKALEGNCLKDCLGLFRLIHSTELFSALDLQPTIEFS